MRLLKFALVPATALVMGTVMLGSTAQAEEKIASGALLASNCFNCHGYNGRSVGVVDELETLSGDRIGRALRAFKAEEKPATIMDRISKGYSDAEIDAIAEYFETFEK